MGVMKKLLLLIFVISVMMSISHVCEAGVWDAYYLNVPGYYADDSRVTDRFSWDSPFFGPGYTHLAVTWNNQVVTASGIEMDPDGVPLVYYWADVYPAYYDLYYSFDGYNWYHYGSYVY